MNLDELREKRLMWVEANRENGFDAGIQRLLTELYPDNAHFIYELLQNAEDAKATEVRFILNTDRVEFEHNGDRLFSMEDVKSITSFGDSTKKGDPTNIGKFGVGFKAVFAYTATPEIESGQFHFRIRDLVVPDVTGLTLCIRGKEETHFSFPFNNPKKSPEKARDEIENNLLNLDESTLLFLSNIKKIEYRLPDSTLGFLERKEIDGIRIEILVQRLGVPDPDSIHYLRFEKTVEVNDEDGEPKSCRIAVAFGMEKIPGKEWKIKLLDRGHVCIYFPAEKETSNLRFQLHAPFASTVARDSVRDCEANDNLRDQLAELIAGCMTTIRDQGLLNVEFLAVLPNDRDNLSPFYLPIQKRLVREFNKGKLTPMKWGKHAAASVCYRGTRELSDLIQDEDLATLLCKDDTLPLWIANPRQLNQREDNFLSMLDISSWNIWKFIETLKPHSVVVMEWLQKKSDVWHQTLYAFFLNDETFHDELSKLRIVRCRDGIYRVGSECYFPSDDVEHDEDLQIDEIVREKESQPPVQEEEDKDFHYVVKDVYSSGRNRNMEKAREFLKKIGVRIVDDAERVKAILKQRYREELKPLKEDLERFIALVDREPDKVSLFKDYPIFEMARERDNERWFGKPSQVFLDTPYLNTGLRAYFEALGENSGQKWALSSKYKDSGIEQEKLGKFAKAVCVQTQLEVEERPIPCEHPEFNKLKDLGGWSSKYGINKDYNIPAFGILLDAPDLSKSKLIWDTMNELPDDYLQAEYRSNIKYYNTANSTLVHELRDTEWVPQKQNGQEILHFLKPTESVAEFLPKGFPYEPESKWLEAIEFGKSRRDREENERRKNSTKTKEYQHQSDAAKALGFSSAEEAQELAMILKKNPELISWWKAEKQKPTFPEESSWNPVRRRKKFEEQYGNALEKKSEQRTRSVRTTETTEYTRTWLKEKYTNEEEQMMCQICQKEMPFKKRDGEYYFEAVEILTEEYLPKEQEAQSLALCPICAAMYKELVKRDKEAMESLKNALMDSDALEIPLQLGERNTSIRFVENHWQDIKTILQKTE